MNEARIDMMAQLAEARRKHEGRQEERDELFQLMIGRTTTKAVERILAAGYRKPRQVTTVEELDALPEGTVIRDASGIVRDRFNESETGAALWLRPGAQGWTLSRNFADKHFPATVLHEGGAE